MTSGVLDQHAAWLARSIGRTDYLPMRPEDALALADAGEMVSKHAGTHLFRQGAESTACYIVREGEVELYRASATGRSVVGRLGPGSIVGDIAMFSDRPYLSSARTVDRVRALRLERTVLVPLLLQRPVLAMRWMVHGLGQLEATQQRLLRLMDRTVAEQVAGLLLDEADAYGEVTMSQAAIAELLGASRQSVNEAVGHWRSIGAVDTGYRRITIIEPSLLRAATQR